MCLSSSWRSHLCATTLGKAMKAICTQFRDGSPVSSIDELHSRQDRLQRLQGQDSCLAFSQVKFSQEVMLFFYHHKRINTSHLEIVWPVKRCLFPTNTCI